MPRINHSPKDCPSFINSHNKDTEPIVYLHLYQKLVERFGQRDMIAPTTVVLELCHRLFHNIPRKYDYLILADLEKFGFIEKIDKLKIKFNGYESNKKLRHINRNFIWSS